MHPGPMNRGIEIDTKLADDINKSVIKEQVELRCSSKNGLFKNVLYINEKTIFYKCKYYRSSQFN
jgi:aspartate carbamoyltransferase catalytic subunit